MRYKRPESVLVVIYTKEFEVLLLQRSDVPNFWQSVTGSLQAGETPLEAARREVWEETGLVTTTQLHDCQFSQKFSILPPWRHRYDPAVTHNTEHVFTFLTPAHSPIRLSPKEHSAYQWVDYQLALEKVTSYTNREAIAKFLGR